MIKTQAAQIWQFKTTNEAKTQGFGCTVRKSVVKFITYDTFEIEIILNFCKEL